MCFVKVELIVGARNRNQHKNNVTWQERFFQDYNHQEIDSCDLAREKWTWNQDQSNNQEQLVRSKVKRKRLIRSSEGDYENEDHYEHEEIYEDEGHYEDQDEYEDEDNYEHEYLYED